MIRLIHKLFIEPWFLITLYLLFLGCGQDQITSNNRATPELIEISPDSGAYGTEVTLKGKNFSSKPDQNIIHFNNTEAGVISATRQQIMAKVPLRAKSGSVTVTVNNQTSNELQFTYLRTFEVELWAGSHKGYEDAIGPNARFNNPWGIAISSRGSLLIGDSDNSVIRKVESNKNVTTLAGSILSGHSDDIGSKARFAQPMGVALNPGGILYVADSDNHSIRSVNLNGEVQTLAGNGLPGSAGGKLSQTQFHNPSDIAIESDNTLYISDGYNFKIRMIGTDRITKTLAGSGIHGFRDGPADQARFMLPLSIALSPNEEMLYVVDYYGHSIRTVDIATGYVRTITGNGSAGFKDGSLKEARFNGPAGIAVTSDGTVFVSDAGNHAIRMIKDGVVSTVAGSGEPGETNGPGKKAQFNRPYHLTLSSQNTYLYISDWGNHQIRRMLIQ
jgi:sugar lactone lactonase YvrE